MESFGLGWPVETPHLPPLSVYSRTSFQHACAQTPSAPLQHHTAGVVGHCWTSGRRRCLDDSGLGETYVTPCKKAPGRRLSWHGRVRGGDCGDGSLTSLLQENHETGSSSRHPWHLTTSTPHSRTVRPYGEQIHSLSPIAYGGEHQGSSEFSSLGPPPHRSVGGLRLGSDEGSFLATVLDGSVGQKSAKRTVTFQTPVKCSKNAVNVTSTPSVATRPKTKWGSGGLTKLKLTEVLPHERIYSDLPPTAEFGTADRSLAGGLALRDSDRVLTAVRRRGEEESRSVGRRVRVLRDSLTANTGYCSRVLDVPVNSKVAFPPSSSSSLSKQLFKSEVCNDDKAWQIGAPIPQLVSYIPEETVGPMTCSHGDEEDIASVSQQEVSRFQDSLGPDSSANTSYYSSVLNVQVKSRVVVPRAVTHLDPWTPVTRGQEPVRRPVVFATEEEWEHRKNQYVQSVMMDMRQRRRATGGVMAELMNLMNSVAGVGETWQHPTNLTCRNYRKRNAGRPIRLERRT
ncbi:S100P-binding protein [Denticeps clupeoides]|uniref:S100P-binding protein n=1 Tax=Denticeps clupeoides TaxID=299321 RepID=UPI0010A5A128|nr:uncharacterized protein LOC114774364 [Denticeps clupeoides]